MVSKAVRLLVACLGCAAAAPVAAFQCAPVSQAMRTAPVVFIGRPHAIIRRNAVEAEAPVIAGTPLGYDLIRFAVIELLKGDLPPTIDVLCPVDDVRCRVDDHRRSLVAALPGLYDGTPQKLFCNMDAVAPEPGTQAADANLVRGLIEKFRASRTKR